MAVEAPVLDPRPVDIARTDSSIIEYNDTEGKTHRARVRIFVPTADGKQLPKVFTAQEWKTLSEGLQATVEKTIRTAGTTFKAGEKMTIAIPSDIKVTVTDKDGVRQSESLAAYIFKTGVSGTTSIDLAHKVFGIKNEGNTCFLAAAVQMILADSKLVDAIIATNDPNLVELITFLKAAKAAPSGAVLEGLDNVRHTLERIAAHPDKWKGPQDSNDALMGILTYLQLKHPGNPIFATGLTMVDTAGTPIRSRPPHMSRIVIKLSKESGVAPPERKGQFRLTGFVCYLPTQKHYISYRCIGGEYYKLDDSKYERITREEYLNAGNTAIEATFIRDTEERPEPGPAAADRGEAPPGVRTPQEAARKPTPHQQLKPGDLASIELYHKDLRTNPIIRLYKRSDIFAHSDCEILVNAANPSLQGQQMAGICGQFHQRAGDKIFQEAIAQIPGGQTGIPAGAAVVTGNGNLPGKTTHVVHAVGPDFRKLKRSSTAAEKVAAMKTYKEAYINLLKAAQGKGSKIAIPLLSAGIFNGVYKKGDRPRIPVPDLERAALEAIQEFLDTTSDHGFKEIRLVH